MFDKVFAGVICNEEYVDFDDVMEIYIEEYELADGDEDELEDLFERVHEELEYRGARPDRPAPNDSAFDISLFDKLEALGIEEFIPDNKVNEVIELIESHVVCDLLFSGSIEEAIGSKNQYIHWTIPEGFWRGYNNWLKRRER